MKIYLVEKREVWTHAVFVSAENPDDAKERVSRGEGESADNPLEYSDDRPTDEWNVEMAEE